MLTVRYAARFMLTAMLLFSLASATATAGFLDDLKNAADTLSETLNKASQNTAGNQNANKSSEASSGGTGNAGTDSGTNSGTTSTKKKNCGALGAGCADGMEPLMQCNAKAKGYFWKVTADTLDKKLAATQGLSAEEEANWRADIESVRQAHLADARRVTPVDPNDPDRYLRRLTDDEQVAIGNEASTFVQATRKDCNAKYAKF